MSEITVTLDRSPSGEQGTFGELTYFGKNLQTAELPDLGNRRNVSCIPEGDYPCRLVRSPRFGTVYHVRGVPGRTGCSSTAATTPGTARAAGARTPTAASCPACVWAVWATSARCSARARRSRGSWRPWPGVPSSSESGEGSHA